MQTSENVLKRLYRKRLTTIWQASIMKFFIPKALSFHKTKKVPIIKIIKYHEVELRFYR